MTLAEFRAWCEHNRDANSERAAECSLRRDRVRGDSYTRGAAMYAQALQLVDWFEHEQREARRQTCRREGEA